GADATGRTPRARRPASSPAGHRRRDRRPRADPCLTKSHRRRHASRLPSTACRHVRYRAGVAEWDAELEVDADRARTMIVAQFPELAGLPLRRVAAGWDNVVHLVDERWAFRFPRRQ